MTIEVMGGVSGGGGTHGFSQSTIEPLAAANIASTIIEPHTCKQRNTAQSEGKSVWGC
jgi:hypothetical protein